MAWMEFDFNSYHLVASRLSLDMGYLFFLVGSNILPWMAVQQLVAILVFSQEKMKTRPSAPPSWLTSILYKAPISVRQGLQRFLKSAACVGSGGLSALGDSEWKELKEKGRAGREAPEESGSGESPHSRNYGFSRMHIRMWQSDYKEGWEEDNWCFWTVVLGADSWESLGLQGDQTSQS